MSGLPLDTEKLQEIAERLKKRTPGTWLWIEKPDCDLRARVYSNLYPDGSNAMHDGGHGWSICQTRDRSSEEHSVLWPFPFGENGENDGDFIAHAPEDISALLDEVHRLKEALKVKDIAATAIAVVLRAKCNDAEWQGMPEEMKAQSERLSAYVERAETAEPTLSRLTEERDGLRWQLDEEHKVRDERLPKIKTRIAEQKAEIERLTEVEQSLERAREALGNLLAYVNRKPHSTSCFAHDCQWCEACVELVKDEAETVLSGADSPKPPKEHAPVCGPIVASIPNLSEVKHTCGNVMVPAGSLEGRLFIQEKWWCSHCEKFIPFGADSTKEVG